MHTIIQYIYKKNKWKTICDHQNR